METLRIEHRRVRGHRLWPLYSRRGAGKAYPTLHKLLQSVRAEPPRPGRRCLKWALATGAKPASGPTASVMPRERAQAQSVWWAQEARDLGALIRRFSSW